MVKVRRCPVCSSPVTNCSFCLFFPLPQKWGFSPKIGPVYYNERDDPISPSKQDEIETEVKKYVTFFRSSAVDACEAMRSLPAS